MTDIMKVLTEGGQVPSGDYTVPIDTIRPRAGAKIDLVGVTLRIEPTDKKSYFVIKIQQPDVTITGGTLIGDRKNHIGTGGEHGMGVYVGSGAKSLHIQDMTSRDMWGDGFYIGAGSGHTLARCVADSNRRQGLSIVDGTNITVKDSTFKNTKGTRPEAGIDIEPNRGTSVSGVLILRCALLNNAGNGIAMNDNAGPIRGVKVQDCTFSGNRGAALRAWPFWSWWQRRLFDLGLYSPTSL